MLVSAGLRIRLALTALALAVGFWTLAATARATKAAAAHFPPVPIQHRGATERVVMIFIDSLARDLATDPRRMPVLHQLAQEGASFEVLPCRDQLTYLCLRAMLTGRDDSSLLAIGDNFRPSQEGPPETLLSAFAAQRGRVAVIGSPEFHPYRRAISSERELGKRDETPERVLAEYRAVQAQGAELVIIALTSGDMTAHAHGVGSPEYERVFRQLDAVVGVVAGSLTPGTTLVVFGDHGHDKQGRHLPGTASKTWALYRGPAFRPGATGALRITDHRALLGVVLGVPTEPVYHGPPLTTLLQPAWVSSALDNQLPELRAPASSTASGMGSRIVALVSVLLASLVALGFTVTKQLRPTLLWSIGLVAAGLATLVGLGFDEIRTVVHDHGGDAWRGLCLLVPLGLAGASAGIIVRARALAAGQTRWLATAAATTVLVTLLLMLPTAYYYGSRRSIVLAAAVALGFMLLDAFRHASFVPPRWASLLGVIWVAVVLISLYSVRQLGPETGGASSWALDSPLYTRGARLTLILAKGLLAMAVLWPRIRSHRRDVALALVLFFAGLISELSGLRLPRAVYAVALVGFLAVLAIARSAWHGSVIAAGLLLLGHLYSLDLTRLAPIAAILAAVAASLFVWQKWRLSERAARWAVGLTVAIGSYLMFWPSVGFHLVGIDFSFMFQWVRAEDYEKQWWLIALGVIVKLGLPLLLVVLVASERLRDDRTARITLGTLVAKVLALSIMIAGYALWHDLTSQIALAMLAELALLMFGVCACALALPLAARPAER